jgi:hypothetical protein
LFPLPPVLLRVLGRVPGLHPLRVLTASLFVDKAPNVDELGWRPPYDTGRVLAEMFASTP